MTHPRKKTPVYFMLDTISSALVNSHGEASLLPLLNALVRRVVPKAPGRLRPPPWLWCAIEDIVGAIRGKVVGERGCAVPAQRVPFGDGLLAVHEPTRIESFTERTEGMAHTTLLFARAFPRGVMPPSACGAAQRLGQERSKMRTSRAWQAAVCAWRGQPCRAFVDLLGDFSLLEGLTEWPLSEVESNVIYGERSAHPTGRDWSAPHRMRYPVCKGSVALPVSPAPLPHTAESETAGLNTRSIVWPSRFVSS